ncbi:MAG: 30S ribosomal protein S10 [Candidatus Micrarchaeaceae archaeon]
MGKATIKLVSNDVNSVTNVAQQIKTIAGTLNVKCKGPIPLPTRKLKIAVRRTPCGSGSHTFEKWEMRFHKKLIVVDSDEQVLRQLMRIPVPDNIQIEIGLS